MRGRHQLLLGFFLAFVVLFVCGLLASGLDLVLRLVS